VKIPGYLRLFAKIAGVFAVVLSAVLLLPLMVGVWIPDVINAPVNVLAVQRSRAGETFRVIQYWNHVDFYTTELEYIGTNGLVKRLVLDGDDAKSWRVPLYIDQKGRAVVTLGGGRPRTVDCESETVRYDAAAE
jgi:hypothetical protein